MEKLIEFLVVVPALFGFLVMLIAASVFHADLNGIIASGAVTAFVVLAGLLGLIFLDAVSQYG